MSIRYYDNHIKTVFGNEIERLVMSVPIEQEKLVTFIKKYFSDLPDDELFKHVKRNKYDCFDVETGGDVFLEAFDRYGQCMGSHFLLFTDKEAGFFREYFAEEMDAAIKQEKINKEIKFASDNRDTLRRDIISELAQKSFIDPHQFLNLIGEAWATGYFIEYIKPLLAITGPMIEEILEDMVTRGWVDKEENDNGQVKYYDLLPELLEEDEEEIN